MPYTFFFTRIKSLRYYTYVVIIFIFAFYSFILYPEGSGQYIRNRKYVKAESTFIVICKINNLKADKIYLYNSLGITPQDSSICLNGEFKFQIECKNASFFWASLLFYDSTGKKHILTYKNIFDSSKGLGFFIVAPSEKIKITGKISDTDYGHMPTTPLEMSTGIQNAVLHQYINHESLLFPANIKHISPIQKDSTLKTVSEAIGKFPNSYYLLSVLGHNKQYFTPLELSGLLSCFNRQVENTDTYKQIVTYIDLIKKDINIGKINIGDIQGNSYHLDAIIN